MDSSICSELILKETLTPQNPFKTDTFSGFALLLKFDLHEAQKYFSAKSFQEVYMYMQTSSKGTQIRCIGTVSLVRTGV